jgi:glycosyltransferase involved in cell wall biosynthesis
MRILQVIQTHPPEFSGGSSFFALSLSKQLSQIENVIHVLSTTDNSDIQPYCWSTEILENYTLTRVRTAKRIYSSHHVKHITKIAEDLIDKYKIEIISLNSSRGLGEGVIRAAKNRGIPVGVLLNDGSWVCPNQSFDHSLTHRLCKKSGLLRCVLCKLAACTTYSSFSNWPLEWLRAIRHVYRTLYRHAPLLEEVDFIIAPCVFAKRQHEIFKVRKDIDVILHRIDESTIPVKLLQKIRHPLRFGTLGSFRLNKGGDFLVRAVNELGPIARKIEIHVWGGVPEEMRKKYATTLYQSPYILHDRYSHSEIRQILDSFDVLIHTSVWDTMPLTILEALAARTPVISVDSCGMSEEVFNEKNGWLYDRGDVQGLSNIMLKLIQNPLLVDEIRSRMQPSPSFVEMVAKFQRLYSAKIGTKQYV